MKSNYGNLRGYFFGNMYLSSIQQGIQAAHVIQQMQTDYFALSNTGAKFLSEWMFSDRTMVLLNGGYQSNLVKIHDELKELTFNGTMFPVSMFKEEEDALNGSVTSVGIVVPEIVWNPESFVEPLSQEMKRYLSIFEILSSYKTAR